MARIPEPPRHMAEADTPRPGGHTDTATQNKARARRTERRPGGRPQAERLQRTWALKSKPGPGRPWYLLRPQGQCCWNQGTHSPTRGLMVARGSVCDQQATWGWPLGDTAPDLPAPGDTGAASRQLQAHDARPAPQDSPEPYRRPGPGRSMAPRLPRPRQPPGTLSTAAPHPLTAAVRGNHPRESGQGWRHEGQQILKLSKPVTVILPLPFPGYTF